MKIQCSCGAKYSFDITPDMLRGGVDFVCPACGVDGSEFVTKLVRQELAATASLAPKTNPEPATAAARPAVISHAIQIATEVKPGPLRLHAHTAAPARSETAPLVSDTPPRCAKHGGQLATEKCFICSKPICPACMELFGYVCSPLCIGKHESPGIDL